MPSNTNERQVGFPVRCLVYKLKRKTLYFVRSGGISLNNGILRNLGILGHNRSANTGVYSSPISAHAYYLKFDALNVDPSNSNQRWYGFPVRCLVILVWTSSVAGTSPCTTVLVLYVALVLMLAVGLVLVQALLRLLQLQLTTSSHVPPVSTRQTARSIVTSASPSAVWYTNYQ